MGAAKATSTLGDLARQVQAQVADARRRLVETRGQLAALQSEREACINAPMHADDLRPLLIEHIKREAKGAAVEMISTVRDFVARGAANETVHGTEAAVYSCLPSKPDAATLAALLNPAETADRILSIAALDPDPRQGLTIEARKAAVAKLDERIAQLNAEVSEIVEALQAAGVREDAEPAKPAPSAEDNYNWTNQGWIRKEDMAA